MFNYNNKEYEIIIIRKNNKNTYIRVKDDLKIYITTNIRTKDKDINNIINENRSSIINMINKMEKRNIKMEQSTILGKNVDIITLNTQTLPELYGNKLYIKDSNIDKHLKKFSEPIFKERLDFLYSKFNEKIPYPGLKIRKMTSRWGVCNRKDKSITLNLELIKMDYRYIDYVIVHELSHFVHFDHSKDFWLTVSKYCPEYKEIRKEMRE